MPQHEIQQQLIEFLNQHADVCGEVELQTDLIDEGILDSLLITDLVLFAQQTFGVELSARDISPDNLGNVEAMSQLVVEKQSKHRGAA